MLSNSNQSTIHTFYDCVHSGLCQKEQLQCKYHFHCGNSTLFSGPPHNYEDKEYGSRKKRGEYIHTGDSVGVVMDTTKGELSFAVNGVNLGVAYKGIPLDKPLVPCVILYWGGDSVELDASFKFCL